MGIDIGVFLPATGCATSSDPVCPVCGGSMLRLYGLWGKEDCLLCNVPGCSCEILLGVSSYSASCEKDGCFVEDFDRVFACGLEELEDGEDIVSL